MANIVDPDQTPSIGVVCSGSTLFASILNSSVMLDNYFQQTTSADDIFRCIFSWLTNLPIKAIGRKHKLFLTLPYPTTVAGYRLATAAILSTIFTPQVLAFQKSWRSLSPIIVCILAHCILPF